MEGKIQKWSNKGLNTIGDLIGEDGNLMSMDKNQRIIQEKCNFLLYIRIQKKTRHFEKAKYLYLEQTDASTSLCIVFS